MTQKLDESDHTERYSSSALGNNVISREEKSPCTYSLGGFGMINQPQSETAQEKTKKGQKIPTTQQHL